MGKTRPSIRDLAQASGFSKSTVSLALNGDRRLQDKTRRHILKMADKIGYERDAVLSEYMAYMGRKHPQRKGAVVGMLSFLENNEAIMEHSYARSFYETVKERAEALGYRLEVFFPKGEGIGGARLSRILKARGIQVLILAPSGLIEDLEGFDFSAFSVASCMKILEEPELHRVEPDYFHNTLFTLQELYRLGYRRMFVAFQGNFSPITGYMCEAAVSYFRDSVKEAHVYDVVSIPGYDLSPYDEWLKNEKPDVVVSNAMGAYNWIKHCGFNVPSDIGYAQLTINPRISGKVSDEYYITHKSLSGIDVLPEVVDAAVVDLAVAQAHRHERGVPEHPRVSVIRGRWRKGRTLARQTNRSQ